MILKRKLYTSAEGRNTKKVRKKTDPGDIAIASGFGGLGGYALARAYGGPRKATAILGASMAGLGAYGKAARRKKITKKGKTPHKPEELALNREPGKLGKAVVVSGAALTGAGLAQKSSRERAVEIINEIINGKSRRMKKANPEDLQKARAWIAMNRAALGMERGNQKIIEDVVNSEFGKKYVKARNLKGAAIGGVALGTAAALSLRHNQRRNKKLREAYEKDVAEYREEENKK